MLEGRVDVAVHSLKDVPVHLPEGLRLAATLERADPRSGARVVGHETHARTASSIFT